MMFGAPFIKSVLTEATISGTCPEEIPGCSLHSRDIHPGELFVALKGVRVDGHDFIGEVLLSGACGAIISQSRADLVDEFKGSFFIIVPDPQDAFIALAKAWRSRFTKPVVGITGSVGKTSTKEILAQLLQEGGLSVCVSQGNHNTILGAALTIVRWREHHDVFICEMGISKPGEMAVLADLIRPTVGIITAVGHSHMEGLGTLADIAREKRDIFKYFQEEQVGIINGDIPALASVSYSHPVIKYGSKTSNHVQARKVVISGLSAHLVLKLYGQRFDLTLDTIHEGRIMNSLAALSAAQLLGVSTDILLKRIQEPFIISGRFQPFILAQQQGLLIHDSYNASPESMRAALHAFEKVISETPKIAVLGDMLELGVNSNFWHRQLGRLLSKSPSIKRVILVGTLTKLTRDTLPAGVVCDQVDTWQEAVPLVRQNFPATFLIKGSFGTGLHNLVREVTQTTPEGSTHD